VLIITELKSIPDIWTRMPSEVLAQRFLEGIILSTGRHCLHCESVASSALRGRTCRPGLYQCRDCRLQFTVTTHTQMHGTKLDLRIWICAMFLVLTSSKGISSVVMARLLGVNRKTGWKMGQAIREMMDDRNAEPLPLEDIVEVDEAYVGGAPLHCWMRAFIRKVCSKGRGCGLPEKQTPTTRFDAHHGRRTPQTECVTVMSLSLVDTRVRFWWPAEFQPRLSPVGAEENTTQPASQRLKSTRLALASKADIVLDLHCDHEGPIYLYVHELMFDAGRQLARSLHAAAILTEAGADPSSFVLKVDERWTEECLENDTRFSATLELRGMINVTADQAEHDAQALYRYLVDIGTVRDSLPRAPANEPIVGDIDAAELILTPALGALLLDAEIGEWMTPCSWQRRSQPSF